MNQTGNVEGTTAGGSLALAFWTNTFSNIFLYTANIQNIETAASKADYQIHNIQNIVRINIYNSLFGVAAVDWEKNEPRLIKSRLTVHGGLGYDLLNRPGHTLGILATIGRTSESTTVHIPDLEENYTSLFLMNEYSFKVTNDLTLTQRFDFFAPVDNLSHHRSTLKVAMNTTLYRMIGLALQFNLNYENNPHDPGTALQPDIKKLDTSQTVSLTFQL